MVLNPIAIVGAGTMGHGIAQVCAQGGCDVILIDAIPAALENARARIGENVHLLIENGLLNTEVNTVINRISFSTNLDSAIAAAMVIEAIPEKFDLKQILFKKLASLCRRNTILATNTSGIPVTKLAATIDTPERVIGTHFYMPAHLIPLVEVVQTDKTDEDVVEQTIALLRHLGKKPVRVRKDVPGFIGNRLQHALAREAMSLVQKGVASAEDIDTVVKTSLAVRLVFTGPIEQRDFNGLDTHLAIAEYLYPDLENGTQPLTILKDKVADGYLGIKTGQGFFDWRQRNVAAVHAEKNQALIDLLKLIDTKRYIFD